MKCVQTLLWLATVWIIASPRVSGEERATVWIHAIDRFGNGLGPLKVTRFVEPRVGAKDYSNLFTGAEGNGIPYGDYNVFILVSDKRLGGTLRVDAPMKLLILNGDPQLIVEPVRGVRLHPSPGPLHRITGLPEDVRNPVWVRIVPLFETESLQRIVRAFEDGSFSLSGAWLPGTYAISVLDARHPLFIGTFELKDPKTRVEIDLKAGTIRQEVP